MVLGMFGSTQFKARRRKTTLTGDGPWWQLFRDGHNYFTGRPSSMLVLVTLVLALVPPARATFVNFDNCLDPSIVNSRPRQLQLRPYFVNVWFNTSSENYRLNVTIYGNVTGQATQGEYPPPDSQSWQNPNDTFGKIVDLSKSSNRYTTLFSKFNMLTYTPYNQPSRFCNATVNGSCPLVPSFNANRSHPSELSAFSVQHDFYSSYAFSTLAGTFRVQSGEGPIIACVSTNITPDLGSQIKSALTWVPAVILAFVGLATVMAAMWSPWGTTDPFRWTSNYGRDEDLLRLVTPGFGDCLQYIQFIVLSGSLSLNYPGFYQPVVSRATWSTLMFNESFLTHGNGTQSLVDGIYNVNGTYGLDRMSQLVGMTSENDIWAGMVIWLLIVIAAVLLICQLGFLARWCHRLISDTHEQDMRHKNWPFSGGNVVRITFNYFLLPLIALSMFQLVIAPRSPASVVAGAVVLLVLILGVAIWTLRLIFTTRPRAHLFDDLPTVLLYGPLYNTYSDDAAPFAFIPVLITFGRGVAIGAIQPSGIAQLILLAICEVVLILTLNAFRPFQMSTSMNAYHTFFAVVRLVTVLLMVAFVPTLGITEAPKGWLGYAVLVLHAIVLIFGFFLNALQTIIEVLARLAGAGGDSTEPARGGLTKVFGVRQLSRRAHRRGARSSMNSNATMLNQDADTKSIQLAGGRSRSLSASSAVLLQRSMYNDHRSSGAYDLAESSGPATPGGAASPFSFVPTGASSTAQSGIPTRRPTLNLKTDQSADPYYRPPRQRRPTLDAYTPGSRSRGSWHNGEWQSKPPEDFQEDVDAGEGPSAAERDNGRITPALLRDRNDSETNLGADVRRQRSDYYASREVDYYFGLRGPALSSTPGRKLKTGPADPVGPVSSATGWLKGFFGGKSKDKGKGFEVVRSRRAQLQEEEATGRGGTPVALHEPYRDSPTSTTDRATGGSREQARANRPISQDITQYKDERMNPTDIDNHSIGRPSSVGTSTAGRRTPDSDDDEGSFEYRPERVSDVPPMLGPIETGGGIELPSRIGSRASHAGPYRQDTNESRAKRPPLIPARSTRRTISNDGPVDLPTLGEVAPASPPRVADGGVLSNRPANDHLQPGNAGSRRLPFRHESSNEERLSAGANSSTSSLYPSDLGGNEPPPPTYPPDYPSSTAPDPSDPQATESYARSLARQQPYGHVKNQNSLTMPTAVQERPTSVGYVNQHRAVEGLRSGGVEEGQHLGSSAELVDAGNPRRSGSTQRSAGIR